jgi:hypothetical protein
MTHVFNSSMLRTFRHLVNTCPPDFEPVVLINGEPPVAVGPLLEGIRYAYVSTAEARNRDYGAKAFDGANWHIAHDGHTDLLLLRFAQMHPEFDQFWSMEYDVRFSGAWRTLFDAFRNSPAEFLATTVRTAADEPDWFYWSTLRAPVPLRDIERLRCFMPIFRASRAAVEVMDQAYRAGWSGHLEATWPTVLNHAGLMIEDIGGNGAFVTPENRNRFYSNSPTWNLAPGSFVFKPARFLAGYRRNYLWHPVKPPKQTSREYLGRMKDTMQARVKSLRARGRAIQGRLQQISK